MIQNIKFEKYKKLKDVTITFKKGINIIAGNNGTCKSSILHIISNSFKKTTGTSNLIDKKCMPNINKLNKYVVPKVEGLNKLSRQNKINPQGTVYTVEFFDGTIQEFRVHNTEKLHRFSLKPKYKSGTSETLKESLVIYLSLDRLYPYGEFDKDEELKKISNNLPEKYLNDIKKTFSDFTGHKITIDSPIEMGGIKKRLDFSTENKDVDSNNISSGEDNLLIMLISLYSLIYYLDNLSNKHDVYLLIDEYDASLHPEFQIKFLNLISQKIKEYPELNFVVTTHSLTTIEEALKKRYNVIYLSNYPGGVSVMNDPDLKKIKAGLHSVLYKNLYNDIKIPVIMEDNEARIFYKRLFKYISLKNDDFKKIEMTFDLVEASFSCETIKSLFRSIPKKTFPAIGIVDGDTNLEPKVDIGNALISLPGKEAPEKIIQNTCNKLLTDESEEAYLFWNVVGEELGFNFEILKKEIIPKFEKLEEEISKCEEEGSSTKGIRREKLKNIFNEYDSVFKYIFDYWINDLENQSEVDKFFENLKICYYKVCDYHGASNSLWPKV